MVHPVKEDDLIKNILASAKTIAMVGVSSIKQEVSTNIKRRPSVIVMKYLQEFGYRVIPVNPFSAGKEIYGETVVAQLGDIKIPIDIVDVFRPSTEAPELAKQAATLDHFTKGRFLLGVGLGSLRYEFEALFPNKRGTRRGDVLDEGLEALQLLLTQDVASYKGNFYEFDNICITPISQI